MSVCLFVDVCPLAYLKNRTSKLETLRNFLYILPVALARSSSDNNAIFRFLWMTSCFPINNGSLWQPACGHRAAASSHKFLLYSPGGATLFDCGRNTMAANCAVGVKSAVYDCLVVSENLLFMAALWNRAGHYLLPCGFFLLFYSSFLFLA